MSLNIAWVSASPIATTGYGVQTREIASRIIANGKHKLKCIGGIGGQTVWGGHTMLPVPKLGVDIEILPTIGDMTGRDVIDGYNKEHKFDVVISLWDCFAIHWLQDIKVPACMYIPIDAPFTKRMYNYVKGAFYVIAYSKFGYNELLKWLPPSKVRYIPHGIDTDVFKPASKNENKEMREQIGVPEDAFLIIDAGANVGERKQLPLLMMAFSEFAKIHDDAYLYLFSNPMVNYPQGYDLIEFAHSLGIADKIRYPALDPIIAPWPSDKLANLYSCADVFMTLTIGEGFGIPMAEAMACGTPVIGTNCSSVPELVEGHGWVIDTVPPEEYVFVPVWIPTNQVYPVPNMMSAFFALEDAYTDRDKLKEYSFKSRMFIKDNYDWSKIMPLWVEFLDEIGSDFDLLRTSE